MKVIYRAFDGKEFESKYVCEDYEISSFTLENAKKAIALLNGFCSQFEYCEHCPLFDGCVCYLKFDNHICELDIDEIEKLKE